MNQISVTEQLLLKARNILMDVGREHTVSHNIISSHGLYFSTVEKLRDSFQSNGPYQPT